MKQSLDGIHEAKKEGWRIFNNPFVPVREKLLALKIIMHADETRFKLLSEGPSLLAMKDLQRRVSQIEIDKSVDNLSDRVDRIEEDITEEDSSKNTSKCRSRVRKAKSNGKTHTQIQLVYE